MKERATLDCANFTTPFYSMTIANSPLVAWPIKMQDLH